MDSNPLDEKEIRYQIAQIEELPALPQALKRLIEIIHSEIDTPGELESIIGYDPSLAAKVVMVGNTSYYGYRKRVNTLSKAISIIGADQIKSICICTLLMNLLSNRRVVSPAHREMLWKHAFASSKYGLSSSCGGGPAVTLTHASSAMLNVTFWLLEHSG